MFKLEKNIKLYKNHFETLCMNLYQSYYLERLSLDIDALLFRIKYMARNNKDIDKIEDYKKEFEEKTLKLRKAFGKIIWEILISFVTIPSPFKMDDIEDIVVQDVIMNSTEVNFKMVLISGKKEFLEYVDKSIPDDEVYVLYPNQYFRYYTDSYNDGIAKAYPELFETRHQDKVGVGDDGDIFVHNLTFQTTENCSLNCSYCYQFNKSPMRMEFNTAKMFIDKLLNDEYGYINRHNSPAIIIEFIGGEPLLEIDLTRKIYEYFLDRCYELNHPWFTMHRLSICSNGLQYFNPEVQDFFKLYHSQVSFNISIDGNKQLHDSCRVQPNGEGSYDIDITALNHYNKHYAAERNSKMTLAPSNITYLCESVIDFIEHDMKSININCIFEEGWTPETAKIEYYQLKKLADYIIDNHLENIYIAIFRERQEDKNDIQMDSSFCGGSGSMLAIRPNGQFYPCIRYMPTSVGDDVRDLCLGTVQDGMIGRTEGSEILEEMDRNTRRSQSNDICFDCPIGNSCAACSALGQTVFGNFAKKTSFHCIQVIAEALANVYYWNRLILKHPEYDLDVRVNNVPDEWARIIIDDNELDELKLIEMAAQCKKLEQDSNIS